MKRIAVFIFLALLTINPRQVTSQTILPKGVWKFDDKTNITKAQIGNNLDLIGTATYIDGPIEGNGAIRIESGSYLRMNNSIAPNGGGGTVNEYTIQIDFKISNKNEWHCFYQTNPYNKNDGECFISPDGRIGIQATGYSNYVVNSNEWYRLVVSVKNGYFYNYYLDGQKLLTGSVQIIDGRFSLEKSLLLFADDNGEDGTIDCAEVAIWDYPLSYEEVKLLGGYGHTVEPPSSKEMVLIPYLQTPTESSVYISWHHPFSTFSKVEFGTTSSLGETSFGSSEAIGGPYRWHTVKLTGLKPNTEYFYRAISDSNYSKIYAFRTLPLRNAKEKIRLLLFSDTHERDTTMAVKVVKSAKKKLEQLFGSSYYNNINLILHAGDLVMNGGNVTQYTDQYFAPFALLSPNIPIMTVAGNHEEEKQIYYDYMKFEDVSAFPVKDPLSEKCWSINIANTTIIGINSNIVGVSAAKQKEWLNGKLADIENDSTIDFVIIMVHHLPISELWIEGSYGFGSSYVRDEIIPILKRYSKVVQLSYGHTHGYENGAVESEAVNSIGDFRIVCGGGGGGAIDRWGSFRNAELPSINISLDHYFFQLIEIDAEAKTFEAYMYSLGNLSKIRNNELMDKWYRKITQPAPQVPVTYPPTYRSGSIIFNSSSIDKSSSDSLMTVRIQIANDSKYNYAVIDTMVHWRNIFGVDNNYEPTDLNKNINLTKLELKRSRLASKELFYYRVKYRDHNLRWSDWSNSTSFSNSKDIIDSDIPREFELKQNFPNPCNPRTTIVYNLPKDSYITLKIYDILGNEVALLVNENKKAGHYETTFDGSYLSSGVYFYTIQAGKFSQTKKLILIK